jgi:hypothetical protein
LTSTIKAIGTQEQTRESSVANISLPGTGEKIASAGTFPLKWDVTRERSGPLTARDAAGISPERLPYMILATDILIEGCGWVELVAQVRKRPRQNEVDVEIAEPKGEVLWKPTSSADKSPSSVEEDALDDGKSEEKEDVVDPTWPTVEVFTPNGKFIATRQPMNAWLYAKKPVSSKVKGRPRKSMKGHKKAEKRRARQQM